MIGQEHLYKNVYVKYRGIITQLRRSSDPQHLLFDFTLEDGQATWTVEVFIEEPGTLKLKARTPYVILARFQGFARKKNKAVLNAVVIEEFIN